MVGASCALGLEPSGASPRGYVRVPNVIDLSRPAINRIVKADGFRFRTAGPGAHTRQWTHAVRQSPRPGALVRRGHRLTIVTGRGPITTRHLRHEELGAATWYDYFPGRCASPTLAFGTRVTVTATATGRSISCRVTDREGVGSDRVVDLSQTQFSRLAPLTVGVVWVRVTW